MAAVDGWKKRLDAAETGRLIDAAVKDLVIGIAWIKLGLQKNMERRRLQVGRQDGRSSSLSSKICRRGWVCKTLREEILRQTTRVLAGYVISDSADSSPLPLYCTLPTVHQNKHLPQLEDAAGK